MGPVLCRVAQAQASELEEPSRAELARVITAGVCMEASFTRGKSEAGRDASQVRTWEGWHHHMALALNSVWFLRGATHRGQPWTPALTLPHVRDGWSVLLMEVFRTLSVPSMCRTSPADECATRWPACPIIVPVTGCHQGSDVEIYRRAMLPYDATAAAQFARLRHVLKFGPGTQDLRIAAMALSRGATLVTRNQRDCESLSGLQLVDWSLSTP